MGEKERYFVSGFEQLQKLVQVVSRMANPGARSAHFGTQFFVANGIEYPASFYACAYNPNDSRGTLFVSLLPPESFCYFLKLHPALGKLTSANIGRKLGRIYKRETSHYLTTSLYLWIVHVQQERELSELASQHPVNPERCRIRVDLMRTSHQPAAPICLNESRSPPSTHFNNMYLQHESHAKDSAQLYPQEEEGGNL